jgi:hypothetical protein
MSLTPQQQRAIIEKESAWVDESFGQLDLSAFPALNELRAGTLTTFWSTSHPARSAGRTLGQRPVSDGNRQRPAKISKNITGAFRVGPTLGGVSCAYRRGGMCLGKDRPRLRRCSAQER